MLFRSRGHDASVTARSSAVLDEWTVSDPRAIPVPQDENIRLNLWLYRGQPPSDAREVEVIIKQFEFIPSRGIESSVHRSFTTLAPPFGR